MNINAFPPEILFQIIADHNTNVNLGPLDPQAFLNMRVCRLWSTIMLGKLYRVDMTTEQDWFAAVDAMIDVERQYFRRQRHLRLHRYHGARKRFWRYHEGRSYCCSACQRIEEAGKPWMKIGEGHGGSCRCRECDAADMEWVYGKLDG